MTELERVYDQKFDSIGRKLECIYLDALPRISAIDEQSIVDNWDNFVIIPPSVEFVNLLNKLVQQKRYSEIFGENFDCQGCIFDDYGFFEYKLDSLHVYDLRPLKWLESVIDNPQVLPNYIQQVKKQLGPQFPGKVKGYSVILAAMNDPNRKNVVLTTYDSKEGEHVKSLFQQFANWFDSHTRNLIPQFQSTNDEIKGWLQQDYGMNPTKDGFIKWYMDTKMNAGIQLKHFTNSDGTNNLEFDFSVLQNKFTPKIVEQDLQEYCRWRQQRYQKGKELEQTASAASATELPAPEDKNESDVPLTPPYFKPEIQDALYEAIAPFVDTLERISLSDFIKNRVIPNQRITVNCRQNEFGAAFFNTKAVPIGKAKSFGNKLPNYFVRHDGERLVEFSPSTLEKHLRGKDLPKQ